MPNTAYCPSCNKTVKPDEISDAPECPLCGTELVLDDDFNPYPEKTYCATCKRHTTHITVNDDVIRCLVCKTPYAQYEPVESGSAYVNANRRGSVGCSNCGKFVCWSCYNTKVICNDCHGTLSYQELLLESDGIWSIHVKFTLPGSPLRRGMIKLTSDQVKELYANLKTHKTMSIQDRVNNKVYIDR